MPRKILLLSLYYPPDISAGSFRAEALVKALLSRGDNVELEVVAGQPSRYSSFVTVASSLEQQGNLTIHRIELPYRAGGLIGQARQFLVYSVSVLRLLRGRDYDLVIATSSRLMTAVLGRFIAMCKRAPLYLDIRDILVETFEGVFKKKRWKPAVAFLSVLEGWAIKGSFKVNVVSEGFLPYFKERYPQQEYSVFPNGVDSDFDLLPFSVPEPGQPLKVLYAGNIGDGQGLHHILPLLAKSLEGRVVFQVVGDGGRSEALQAALTEFEVVNVEMLPPVPRSQILDFYRQADILFLHLNDIPAFKRVLPSKLFEYAATGKPIWAGVSGYAAEFITTELDNAAAFSPCDIQSALKALETLRIKSTNRSEFVARYRRDNIMSSMADDIIEHLPS